MLPRNAPFRTVRGNLVLLAIVAFLCSSVVIAQQPSSDSLEKPTLQLLLHRIDELEARVRQLEANQQQTAPPRAAVTPATADPPVTEAAHGTAQATAPGAKAPDPAQISPSSSQDQEPSQSENVMTDRMDVSKTLLRIRGFGDVSLHGDTQHGDTTSFSLGQLDLFITSDVSDKFRFLSEVVFEGGPDNIYGTITGEKNSFSVDVERYLLQYSYNDYFNFTAGRGHTAIGYYNTAYHHSSWLQTATGRPFLYSFEDRGGILPVHTVGVSVFGQIPSRSLGLHYVAELGNGRASRTPFAEDPVQNVIDDQNHKAFNLAAFIRPEAIRGFQTGFSVYRDLLAPSSGPRIGETILAAHAVLIRPKYEWLNEALLDRHVVHGTSSVFNTPGFYTQMSRQLGSYRPYFRYEYVNVADNEPVYADVALRHGPTVGVRYDASESVALKLQYDYTFLRNQPGVTELALQLGFTF